MRVNVAWQERLFMRCHSSHDIHEVLLTEVLLRMRYSGITDVLLRMRCHSSHDIHEVLCIRCSSLHVIHFPLKLVKFKCDVIHKMLVEFKCNVIQVFPLKQIKSFFINLKCSSSE